MLLSIAKFSPETNAIFQENDHSKVGFWELSLEKSYETVSMHCSKIRFKNSDFFIFIINSGKLNEKMKYIYCFQIFFPLSMVEGKINCSSSSKNP